MCLKVVKTLPFADYNHVLLCVSNNLRHCLFYLLNELKFALAIVRLFIIDNSILRTLFLSQQYGNSLTGNMFVLVIKKEA